MLYFRISNTPTNKEGYFPLQLAAKNGYLKLVDMLLGYGADITKCDLSGRNTLHFAVKGNKNECNEVLKV